MDAKYACIPSDDETRSLQATQDIKNVVQETVKEINKRKDRETNVLISNAQNQKQTERKRGRG